MYTYCLGCQARLVSKLTVKGWHPSRFPEKSGRCAGKPELATLAIDQKGIARVTVRSVMVCDKYYRGELVGVVRLRTGLRV
jgi:hypothetical protein